MRNQPAITSLLLAGMIFAISASAAEPVYKWVDSTGHSHYSQSPPEGQKYQTITPVGTVTNGPGSTSANGSSAGGGKPAATPALSTDAAQIQATRQRLCDAARNNQQVLSNKDKPVVSMDLYGKGKAEQLNAAEKTEQLDKARQQVQTYCN
jgi:uncharacterized protein YhaN